MASRQPCPVCEGPAIRVRELTEDNIKALLNRAGINVTSHFPDYKILQCHHCGLFFADPPVPGDIEYYKTVSASTKYYVCRRWEWDLAAKSIAKDSMKSLLEIGCGDGNFLAYIQDRVTIDAIGLDTAPRSIERARSRGFNSHCMTLDEFAAENPQARFDVVCAYHCLEHVADPKGLVASMRKLLTGRGVIFLSVPNSPTSWEALGWTPLNLPPHHLTRWNPKALDTLAEAIGMTGSVQTSPPELTGPREVFWHFLNLTGGSSGTMRDLIRAVRSPIQVAKLLKFALTRKTGDIALLILRPGEPNVSD